MTKLELGPNDAAVVLRGNGELDVYKSPRMSEQEQMLATMARSPLGELAINMALQDEDARTMFCQSLLLNTLRHVAQNPGTMMLVLGVMTGSVPVAVVNGADDVLEIWKRLHEAERAQAASAAGETARKGDN